MKIGISIFLILMGQLGFAFTLNSNTGRGFSDSNIDIHIANTSCTNAGFSLSQYESMIKNAIKEYWNDVPTSKLVLKSKGVGSINISGDTFAQALDKVKNNTILAGCNDSAATEFGSTTSGGKSPTLGAAVMSCSGSNCVAVLILNAHANSLLPTMDKSEIEAVIAHEIGHAIGLGHSEYKHNLMYYAAGGKTQKWLGQDDVDGVTYLYPHDPQMLGLLGSCGTIKNMAHKQEDHSFMLSLILGLLFITLIGFISVQLKRYKTTNVNI